MNLPDKKFSVCCGSEYSEKHSLCQLCFKPCQYFNPKEMAELIERQLSQLNKIAKKLEKIIKHKKGGE